MLRRLWKDEEGSILILFTLLVFVMMGMVGLAIEGGRVLGVDSQLQDLADAAALAGARELDGSAGAMARAEAVARTLLSNSPPGPKEGRARLMRS
jgi:Flp pilus assembly protein TadG